MTIRSHDLTLKQIEFLSRLDKRTDPNFPGLEVADLAIDDFRISYELILIGLIALSPGWHGSFWFRLTELGRRVRNGAA